MAELTSLGTMKRSGTSSSASGCCCWEIESSRGEYSGGVGGGGWTCTGSGSISGTLEIPSSPSCLSCRGGVWVVLLLGAS